MSLNECYGAFAYMKYWWWGGPRYWKIGVSRTQGALDSGMGFEVDSLNSTKGADNVGSPDPGIAKFWDGAQWWQESLYINRFFDCYIKFAPFHVD